MLIKAVAMSNEVYDDFALLIVYRLGSKTYREYVREDNKRFRVIEKREDARMRKGRKDIWYSTASQA